jgi:hypothetical protein
LTAHFALAIAPGQAAEAFAQVTAVVLHLLEKPGSSTLSSTARPAAVISALP